MVGTSGSAKERCALVTAKPTTLPAFTCATCTGMASNMASMWLPSRSLSAGGRALIRDVDNRDAGAQPQEFGSKIQRGARAAAGAEGELARVRLSVVDQILDSLERKRLARDQDERPVGDDRDRRHLGQIERIVLLERLSDDYRR